MSFKDLVIKNRSYRGFDETVKITRQQLEELVDCARLAPAAQNIQPLKYYLSCDSEINGIIQPLTRWAGALPDHNLPYEGHRPTAFIVICFDKTIGGEEPAKFMKDVGICAQTIMLAAAYQDINGCMIGAFSAEKVTQALSLPSHLHPVLILALGKGDEDIKIVEVQNGATKYYRDQNDTHYVPKRSLAEELIN
ncbi:MAG: nitroreductase family protein [Clostridia bacterium]|nr:nitroreductase family protein [Clostridia bacterium]MBR4955318.1 nitroreductase family protein [Clostridia bacterium]